MKESYFDKFYDGLDGVYSIMNIEFPIEILTPVNLLNNEKYEEKYEPIFLNSKYNKDIYHTEAIFKHSSGLYIHLERMENEKQFKIKIVYESKKYEELKIFINSLKKLK